MRNSGLVARLWKAILVVAVLGTGSMCRADDVCSAAELKAGKTREYHLATPATDSVTVTVRQAFLQSELYCLEVMAQWQPNGASVSQTLAQGSSGRLLRVEADADGLLLVFGGNRFVPDGYELRQRMRYDSQQHRFYKAESWSRDDWAPYVAQVETLLVHGAFTQARELVARKGYMTAGGHISRDREFFLLFAEAVHREAMRAWKQKRGKQAADFVYWLISETPVRHGMASPPKDQYVVRMVTDDDRTDNWPRYNVVEPAPENHALINDLAFFLSQSEHVALSLDLLEQVVRFSPERVVAWLNLGDARERTGDHSAARSAYRTYRDLMRERGESRKIPQRVHDALAHPGERSDN